MIDALNTDALRSVEGRAAVVDLTIGVTDFLSVFYPDVQEIICLRALRPRGAPASAANKPEKVRTTLLELGSNTRTLAHLRKLNRTRGLYFVVNAGGDRKIDIRRFNAVFAEADTIPIEEQHRLLDACYLLPSIRVETLKSVHAYWPIDGACNATEWQEAQRRIARYLGSDTSLDDLPQMMRLPGFDHVSLNGNGGFHYKRTKIVLFDCSRRYSIQQILNVFPPIEDDREGEGAGENQGGGGDYIPEGGRNSALTRLAGSLRRHGLTEEQLYDSLLAINKKRCSPPLPHQEVRSIAHSVSRYEPDPKWDRQEVPLPGVSLDDFYAYMPIHKYIFAPSREMWPSASVNARIPLVATGRKKQNGDDEYVPATKWLDQNQAVEQMTWVPGEPMLIRDRLISEGGWIGRDGCVCFNLYSPPQLDLGDARLAEPWLEHLNKVYPDEARHITSWLAHRVQHPGVKINHALLLGGNQGIGKDTILEPVKFAVGPWNFCEVRPSHLLGRFNGFVKSVILRVSEARDLGDVDRYAFYEHMKTYTAAPPDVLRCDEKNLREYAVPNVCGVVITTNHKSDGIYLPADDRRHYVAWSNLDKADFRDGYWADLYKWYEREGHRHVGAYLATLDVSDFDPKAPPPQTAAFWDIVDANRAPEDAELADVLDSLENPLAVTLHDLCEAASREFGDWLRDRKNRRQIPHRLESVGYVPVRNSHALDGLWKVGGSRMAIYSKNSLSPRDRIAAAEEVSQRKQ